ncbi:acyl-CoA synthetase FdrA [bacterium]|nr:acyl-CoA synthetase FdrA [bacterium]
MVVKGIIKSKVYFDSVSLMRIGSELSSMPGVEDVAMVMGTDENKSILKVSEMLLSEFSDSNGNDLLIGVKADSEEIVEKVLEKMESLLEALQKGDSSTTTFVPKSIDGALKVLPEANLAMISIAGKYAANEARKALNNNLHVMIFSDNVSIEDELSLKKLGKEKGLLVMGPDCGTAIINGVPLAFANRVRKGDIGVVGASGTGMQEVTSLISNFGGGVSQAIGTGGRDVKKEIGGVMFLEGLKALKNDKNTKIITLVSKPPHQDVIDKIALELKGCEKPVVALFLGANKEELSDFPAEICTTLEETAQKSVELSLQLSLARECEFSNEDVLRERGKKSSNQKYIRALFSGGTFCDETGILLRDSLTDLYGNHSGKSILPLENLLKSQKHTLIDLGEDDFTVGRPHPMIDFSLRNKRIIQEASDPECSVIILDVVLGYGAHPAPDAELVPIITKALSINPNLTVISYVVGTDADPQNRKQVISALQNAGSLIVSSNRAAALFALEIVK